MVNPNFNEQGVYRLDQLDDFGIEYSSLFRMTKYLPLIFAYYGMVEHEIVHPFQMTEQRAELIRKCCEDFNCKRITVSDTNISYLIPQRYYFFENDEDQLRFKLTFSL